MGLRWLGQCYLCEMKNPRKDLPRVVHISLPTVIAYLLANLSYYAVLSKEELSHSSTVTLAMAKKVIGGWGALVFTNSDCSMS